MDNHAYYLYDILKNYSRGLKQDIHFRYLKEYDKLFKSGQCGTDNPLCNLRLVHYFWGDYYAKNGDYIRAENCYRKALDTDAPAETLQRLPNLEIKRGLLWVYYMENDSEQLLPLLSELSDLMIQTDGSIMPYQTENREFYTIYNEYHDLIGKHGYLQSLRNAMFHVYQEMKRDRSFIKDEAGWIDFICTSVLLFAESGDGTDSNYKIYQEMLQIIHHDFTWTRGLVLRALIRLSHERKFQAKPYVDEFVRLAEAGNGSWNADAETFQLAASYYCQAGQLEMGGKYLQCALDLITKEWRHDIRYSDQRAYQLLEPTQGIFLGCYDTIRKYMDLKFAYEKVIQFKALGSLAGKERIRLLYDGGTDQELLREIRDIQDRIAWEEASKIFRGQPAQYGGDLPRLRDLEADYADQYPSCQTFSSITLDRLQEALPNGSAVVEYLFYEIDYEKHELSSPARERESAIDIYVLCKTDHKCTLRRWAIPDGDVLLLLAREFVSALLEEGEKKKVSKPQKEGFRRGLYERLILPFYSQISGITRIYIAPDRELANVPFEILGDSPNSWLEDRHDIVRIECARDLLFCPENHQAASGSLVMGNPKFALEDLNTETSPMLHPLPFTEPEIVLAGRYCGCQCHSGTDATKKLLLMGNGYRNIHIATHGYGRLDRSENAETMYSSCLFLAGAEDWLRSGRMDPIYGNGVVTADEISRMDLRGTELVVLSTCRSGVNSVLESKEFHGMLGAFSTAGVQYVIAHLWEADDCGAAVLMGYFYYYYMRERQAPPTALKLAKCATRNVTNRQLEEKGWLRMQTRDSRDGQESPWWKHGLRNGRDRPFADMRYWGGFACYRCN